MRRASDYFRKYHDGDLPPPEFVADRYTRVARCVVDGVGTIRSTMTFEEVIQPALDLVENGHPVDDQFHAFASRELGGEPSTNAVFNPGWTYSTSRGDLFPEGFGEHFPAADRC